MNPILAEIRQLKATLADCDVSPLKKKDAADRLGVLRQTLIASLSQKGDTIEITVPPLPPGKVSFQTVRTSNTNWESA